MVLMQPYILKIKILIILICYLNTAPVLNIMEIKELIYNLVDQ